MYGWTKMQELLTVFKEGSTDDKALEQVYLLNVDELEEQWLSNIGAGQ
jgi:hypothetical protein